MRNNCIVCKSKLDQVPLYIMKNVPAVSQNLPTKETLAFDHAMDLRIEQCRKCGLVQLNCDPVSYYKDSTRAAERGEGLINLRKEDYRYFIEKFNLRGKKILEVGAGKGGYLKTLQEMSEYAVQGYGIEHNADFAAYAYDVYGVNVFHGDPENAKQDIPGAPFDAFVSFSYMARLLNPNDTLEMISRNLTDDGVGYVMVPSLEHLLSKEGFFDVARDLLAYYGEESLRFLFEKNGFEVLETDHKLGYYISITVRKRKCLDIASYWSETEKLISDLKKYLIDRKGSGKRIAVWCAGHFAFTVLATAEVGNFIEYIIDNAEFKKGCYSPGTHIPIVGPEFYQESPVDIVMILGPIYIDEIVSEIRNKLSGSIEIVTVDKNGIRQIR